MVKIATRHPALQIAPRSNRKNLLITQPITMIGSENFETQRIITVPMAMNCAASNIHHSPLSQILHVLVASTGGIAKPLDSIPSNRAFTNACSFSIGTYNQGMCLGLCNNKIPDAETQATVSVGFMIKITAC